MNDFSSVAGKVAVVTGATSGIGRAIAEMYANNGMKVVLAGRRQERGDEIVNAILEKGGEAIFCRTDVSVEEDVKRLIQTAADTYGQLNVVVNNAGAGSLMHPIHEFSVEDFRHVCDIDYLGVFMGMKYGVQTMLDTKSTNCAVINISSANGMVTCANYALYDAAKRAVLSLTQTAGLDYAKHDITVNAICPGVIDTEIYSHLSPEQRDYSVSIVPNNSFGKPEDIAYMALFLASDMARYITSAIIPVDAGLTGGRYADGVWQTPDPRQLDNQKLFEQSAD